MLLPSLLVSLPPILPQLFTILWRVIDWERQRSAGGDNSPGEGEESEKPAETQRNTIEDPKEGNPSRGIVHYPTHLLS